MNTTKATTIPSDRNRLAIGIGLSLMLHLVVVLAIAIQPAGPGSPESGVAPLERPPVRLGIARGSPVALAWIGFDSPTPQQAQQASVDQSAFTRATPSAPETEPTPPTEQTSEQPSETSLESTADALAGRLPDFDALARFARSVIDRLPRSQSETTTDSTPAESPAETQPTDQTADASEDSPFQGELADKESLASSKTEPLVFRPGRVLAREGIEIKTVMPILPDYARSVWGGPSRDPVVHMRFLRNGSAFRVRFEPGTMTGVPDIDEPILNAVKSWTATGEQIEAIPSRPRTAGVDVTIRLEFR